MRSLASRPKSIPTLYVKSLGKSSDQDDIRSIFDKAREAAPCLLVFEDIDSLVSDHVRSFFLNEVDGLEGNDGILMIGSTNYCMANEKMCSRSKIRSWADEGIVDKLDAGISKRPSRFDRKYHFALPAMSERIKYSEYWRSVTTDGRTIVPPVTNTTPLLEKNCQRSHPSKCHLKYLQPSPTSPKVSALPISKKLLSPHYSLYFRQKQGHNSASERTMLHSFTPIIHPQHHRLLLRFHQLHH